MVILKRKKLSHDGDCWVYDYASVYDNVKIHLYCKIGGQIYENSEVYGKVKISRNTEICGLTYICGNTSIPEDVPPSFSQQKQFFENKSVIYAIGKLHVK
ncbi:hypothetical protein [Bartonella mastomydis]|uniref:hypothetical protein n=1 Tax=Bartonella mastomydis TaxID=1820002 RepID=UPI001FEBAF7D|nr:hypothetical protein [Bartonella mastomydis]